MPQQEKKITDQKTKPVLILPITATLFANKIQPRQEENKSLDFHLDMIKKIDKLLSEHQPETIPPGPCQTPPLNPPSPPAPIEPRPPLNKAFPHQEIAWEPTSTSPQVMTPGIPAEFKTEISFNPEFRFISGHEFVETFSQTKHSPDDHIEIIDFNTLIRDESGFHKTPDITSLRNEKEHPSIKNILLDDDTYHNKIEIIDTRTFDKKTLDHVLNASEEHSEETEEKAQLYFLNKKESTTKNQQKLDLDQTETTDELEEQTKELRKKLAEEEKKLRQLEQEYEQLEKMEKKKTTLSEKKHTPPEKPSSKKESHTKKSQHDIKKQQKEQKRLKRLQVRQARLEERRQKKLEKQALKLKQKQQQLKMKKTKKLKTEKTESHKTEKNSPVLLIDEDLIKVLHMTDSLLGDLPDDILTDFIESKDYKLYEKVMNKYKIK
jgi:hypothetical protein